MQNQSSNVNTILIVVVIIILLLIGGVWWYRAANNTATTVPTDNSTAPTDSYTGVNLNVGVDQSSTTAPGSY